jgi:hypothetical protein
MKTVGVQCDSCKPGFTGGSCAPDNTKQCDHDWYFDTQWNKCRQCDPSCETCDGPGGSMCKTCDQTKFLTLSKVNKDSADCSSVQVGACVCMEGFYPSESEDCDGHKTI